ncbi:hypothetical protein I3J27_13405 [Bradyrhizobium xenonodulans]|uniref:Nodulation protein NolB n=1 Tax=Bradyrhizobium xenonodulans TaxID=2736875 RepID=A0ABY7MSK4_9BRAD|nr:nodulation protein NolB [Bradyrhizobium xenonodulans]WBL81365.1 hypothetical protein I3J27_13405 [Bradyrhizobium xenonodulans]
MTVGAISSGAVIGGTGTDAALKGIQAAAAQSADGAHAFARSYAAAGQPATPPVESLSPAEPRREIDRPASRNDSLGERILDRLEAIHRADKLGNSNAKKATTGPVVKVAASEPGPAATALRELPSQSDLATRAPRDGSGQFKGMLEQLQQTYGQVIQVSVVSKSSGSFTSSMNRLMSST